MTITTTNVSMEPCPFCKAEGVIIEEVYDGEDESGLFDGWYRAECSTCPCVYAEAYETIQEAIDAWNKRA